MIKRLCLSAVVLVSLAAAIIYFSYSSFRKERLGELESGSQLVETSRGPIEYQIFGDSGPYLLYAHGRPGGYDQGFSYPGFREPPRVLRRAPHVSVASSTGVS